jgi:predicted AAA+ superfamily ATPase
LLLRLRQLYDTDHLHFWCTADGNEVDFIVEKHLNKGIAYEVKYNDVQFKPTKYKKFLEAYPDLECVCKILTKNDSIEAIRL